MKKVIIQTEEQLELVKQEIRVSSLFNHPNLLPLLDHAVIPVKVLQLYLGRTASFEASGVVTLARSANYLNTTDELY